MQLFPYGWCAPCSQLQMGWCMLPKHTAQLGSPQSASPHSTWPCGPLRSCACCAHAHSGTGCMAQLSSGTCQSDAQPGVSAQGAAGHRHAPGRAALPAAGGQHAAGLPALGEQEGGECVLRGAGALRVLRPAACWPADQCLRLELSHAQPGVRRQVHTEAITQLGYQHWAHKRTLSLWSRSLLCWADLVIPHACLPINEARQDVHQGRGQLCSVRVASESGGRT